MISMAEVIAIKRNTEGSFERARDFQSEIADTDYEFNRNSCLFSDFFIAITRRVYGDGSMAGSSFNFTLFASIEKSNRYLKCKLEKSVYRIFTRLL